MFLRKAGKGLALCLVSAMVLTACGSASGKDVISAVRKAGVLNVAIVTEDNPLTVTDGSSYTGTEPELVQKIADALKVKVNYIPSNTGTDATAMLSSGQADMAIGRIPDSMENPNKYGVSDSYASARLYVITATGDYSDSPAAFKGRTLGTLAESGASGNSWSAGVDGLKVVTVASGEKAAASIREKTLDGYVCHLEEGLKLIQDNSAVQMQNFQNTRADSFVIMTRPDTAFLAGINTIIRTAAGGKTAESTAGAGKTTAAATK